MCIICRKVKVVNKFFSWVNEQTPLTKVMSYWIAVAVVFGLGYVTRIISGFFVPWV